MPSRRRELEELTRNHDDEALRALLAEQAEALGGDLGVEPAELRQALELDGASLRLRIERLLGRRKERCAAAREGEHRDSSAKALQQLIATARFRQAHVELDPRLLLGPVLAERNRYVAFHLGEAAVVAVERSLLVRARTALRPFRDVTARLDATALRLSWRGGLGGLVLRPQVVSPLHRDRVLHVVLERPVPAVVPTEQTGPGLAVTPSPPPRSAHPKRSSAFITDVLSELGRLL